MRRLRLALVQLNPFVGDVDGNAALIAAARAEATALHADLLLTPELALSGYPPEDLLLHRGFRRRVENALATIAGAPEVCPVLVGYPEYADDGLYNALTLVGGARQATHHKHLLPNYSVFDEKRYFRAGTRPTLIDVGGARAGLLICEDLWEPGPAAEAAAAGATLLLVANASPYALGKLAEREAIAGARARETGLPVVYLNLVGGQDELVFDGHSFVCGADGHVVRRLPAYTTGVFIVEFDVDASGRPHPVAGEISPALEPEASVYGAVVLGIRDYVGKHRFPGIVLGLSGGIDSALVMALAADALGADRVKAVMMPSRYTAQISLDDAARIAEGMGVEYSVLPIEPMFQSALATLSGEFAGRPVDTTEENLQSRCRGMLLMAISNKTGRMVLTTGNKSEMAVGYATLYGDMAGGFAPIKDLSKQWVYRLSRWLNRDGERIPARIIERPPSAELREDQKDSDSLPPYDVLDAILEAFIEHDQSVDEIAAAGFDRATVVRVLELVRRNEYKRRQAPPGVRVSRRAFGRDWRYPITSGYR